MVAYIIDNTRPLLQLLLAQLLKHPSVNVPLDLLVIRLQFACTDQPFLQLLSNCLCSESVVHQHRRVLDEGIVEPHLLGGGV